MSNDELVIDLFKEANPVRELSELTTATLSADGYLATIQSRIDTGIDETPAAAPSRRRSLVIATAAAFAVIIFGLVVFGALGRNPSPIADTSPGNTEVVPTTDGSTDTSVDRPVTDEEVAAQWLSCALGGCPSDEAVLEAQGLTVVWAESAIEHINFRRLLETTVDSVVCESEGAAPITCIVKGTDSVRSVFGYRLMETWTASITDGVVRVESVELDDQRTMDAFEIWLAANHPSDPADPLAWAASWIANAAEFRNSDSWIRPFDLAIVGEWKMLKGETWTFDDQGIYTVADHNGVYETGEYTFEDGLITITAIESNACPVGTGTYELRFSNADRFGWHLVDDECGIRGQLLNGLADRKS